jgi:hypothetical protein
MIDAVPAHEPQLVPSAGLEPATLSLEVTCSTPAELRGLGPRDYGSPEPSHPLRSLMRVAVLHHTKNKGDLGVAKAHADLVEQGFLVLFPSTERAPFDLVAYDGGVFTRVQVKYRAARFGAVSVHLRSVWSDRQGLHVQQLDRSEVDLICLYCPDSDECYYVRADACGRSVTLRITPPRNNQIVGVQLAASYRSARAAT